MWGVAWTLKAQKKENDENNRLSVKPLFYALHPLQDYDYKQAQDFFLHRIGFPGTKKVWGIIKNTDNGILILEKFVAEKYEYFPKNGTLVDKNTTFNLYIELCDDDNLNTAELHVRDVLGNRYVYTCSINSRGEDHSEELTEYKEITITSKKRKAKK